MVKYGKLVNGVIVYAPKSFNTPDGVIINPPEQFYLARGWKKIVDIKPLIYDGCYFVATGWEEGETVIVRIYKILEIVKPPRRWTPLAIKRAAETKGWWRQLREALLAADLLEEFWGAQYISEADPKFPAIKAGMDALFGEKAVKKFLDTVSQEVGV